MKRSPTSRRIAWIIWSVEVGLVAASLGLLLLNRATILPGDLAGELDGIFFVLAYATMGALILGRQPRHPIGWLFCLLALPMALQTLTQEYAVYGYTVASAALPGLRLAAWLQSWLAYLVFPAPIALPYVLFPTGRLPSPRWRWLVGLVVLASLLTWLAAILAPGQLVVYRSSVALLLPLTNPTGLPARQAVLAALLEYNWTLALLASIAALVAGMVRFRRSRGDERQQLKWFAYLGVPPFVLNFVSGWLPAPWNQTVSDLSLFAIFVSTPLAAGIAIFRYRLYDIDRLIHRTLVYALLSGALSLVYFGSVAVLQQIFAGQSPLVIVASTLLIAVLFAPLRVRIQAVIDRRFHRRRYDAQRILHAFSAHTRNEVNLDRLSDELQSVVQQSVEPATVSLWLRDRHPAKT